MVLMSDTEFGTRFEEAVLRLDTVPFEVTVSHDHRPTSNPRISGLGRCVRQSWYKATGTPTTNPPSIPWSSLLGNFGQGLASLALKEMGYTITDEESEVVIPPNLTGHLDGIITGLDLGEERMPWDSKFRSIWGMYGTKKSYGLAVEKFPYADIEIYMQLQGYMLATSLENAMVTAHPFDLSGGRVQASIKKVPARPAYRHIIPASKEAQDLGSTRGKLLNAATQMGPKGLPNAEFNPNKDSFPCDYCEWKVRCQVVDKGNFGVYFPAIPESWTYAPPGVSEQAAA